MEERCIILCCIFFSLNVNVNKIHNLHIIKYKNMEVIPMAHKNVPLKVTNSFFYTRDSVKPIDFPVMSAESFEKKPTIGINPRDNSGFWRRLKEQRDQLANKLDKK